MNFCSKKILFIKHKGCNLGYLQELLNSYNITTIRLKDFINKDIDQDKIILYQTWPDDRIFQNGNIRKPILDNKKYKELNGKNHHKFDLKFIENADIKFLTLKNKIKILVDLYDDSDLDAFSRYSDNLYPFHNNELKLIINDIKKHTPKYFLNIPRIKNTPSTRYIQKFNVIFSCTYQTDFKILSDKELLNKREKMFHYFNGDKSHPIRPIIKNKLKNLNNKHIYFDKLLNYPEDLKEFLCEINVPGWGKACFRHLDTLSKGCLLLAYEDIKDTYILPNIKLIENKDYILYNLDNLEDKINYILNNQDEINKIRINGYNKFKSIYNVQDSAEILLNNIFKLEGVKSN